MSAVASPPDSSRTAPGIAERWVKLIGQQNLTGIVELYAPDAIWEVHVPGRDEQLTDPIEMLDLHRGYFGRDQFRIDRYELISSGDSVSLNWDLGWLDRQTGLPAASFQCHVFRIKDGLIHLHRMYCAGVRVYESSDKL